MLQVTTQAREGIETTQGDPRAAKQLVTTQAREGIETFLLDQKHTLHLVTTQAREGIETSSSQLRVTSCPVTT